MPRLEAKLSAAFRAKVKKLWPDAFVYKIPDTFGIGGKRPFDCVIILKGHTFCIEFKRGDWEKATEYQDYCLHQANRNGAHSWVVNERNKVHTLKAMEALVNGK